MKTLNIVALSLFGSLVSAHTIFQEVYVNGVDQGHMVGLRDPDYDGVCPTHASSLSLLDIGPSAYHRRYEHRSHLQWRARPPYALIASGHQRQRLVR